MNRDDADILEQIFRESPLPIQIIGADGRPRRTNDAQRAFDEAFGDLAPRFGGQDQPLARALGGVVVDHGFTIDDVGQEPLHFNRLLVPVGEPGRPRAVVSVIVDVTDRRRIEDERTRMEAQLLQTQKLESLGVLAGGIAHDFNNLLVAVLGSASLLLAQVPADWPLRELLVKIDTGARRAAELAHQMLAYAGRRSVSATRVDLGALLRETADLLRLGVSRRIPLRQELSPDLPDVLADVTQLRQVALNLLTNASEAMEGRPGEITLRTGVQEVDAAFLAGCAVAGDARPGAYVFLEVEDHGVGMPPATMARIFDPFFTTKATGRGLGLAAVFGIVRGHGGALSVRSAPEQGTTFRVLFPSLPATRGAEHAAGTAAAAEPPPAPADRGLALVIDDEPHVRALLSRMLEALGFSSVEASDGEEGLALFVQRRNELRLVVLDTTMPRMDGPTTYARLLEAGARVPIVITSGYDASSAVIALGENARFLPKPFTLAELEAVIARR